MSALLVAPRASTAVRPDEIANRAARASLRAQIATLERRAGLTEMELWESGRAPLPPPAGCDREAARLLTLGELEAIRDALVGHVNAAQRSLTERAELQARARRRLEAMLAEPSARRFEIVPRTELGEPGCGAYHVLPRFGLLGMLFSWWCVKLSSGCP
jgi:hypothetical protein